MFGKTLLLALPVVAVATLGYSVANANPAGMLGAVVGQQSGLELVHHGGRHVVRTRARRGHVVHKRGRALAVTRGRGRKIGLRRRIQ